MDYSKSKFDSAVSEACYVIAGHGFGTEFGSSTEGDGWHALVDYSPVLLMNVYADADLIARLRAETNSMAGTAWITEDTQGNVSVRMAALTAYAQPVITKFEAAKHA